MTEEQRTQLDKEGFLVLENFLDSSTLATLQSRIEQLFDEEGENAGSEFRQEPHARRLANLVDKGEKVRNLFAAPEVLEAGRYVLGPAIKLSSLNARSADPYSPESQPLHCDAGALPDEKGYCVCNTIWLLDDFTSENGAT